MTEQEKRAYIDSLASMAGDAAWDAMTRYSTPLLTKAEAGDLNNAIQWTVRQELERRWGTGPEAHTIVRAVGDEPPTLVDGRLVEWRRRWESIQKEIDLLHQLGKLLGPPVGISTLQWAPGALDEISLMRPEFIPHLPKQP